VSADPVARARAAALAELRAAPVAMPWRRQAARVGGAWLGVAVLAGAATAVAGLSDAGAFAARGPALLSLLALAVAAAQASLAPRARPGIVLAAAPVLMAALVLARGAGLPSTTPEWVCSVSHVGVGVLPLAIGLWALRQSAWTWPRALATGLGAGTTGAFLGELACHQGARHVLVHHVGAWVLVSVACVVISRGLRPRTFAP
jgi:hypothetical protein